MGHTLTQALKYFFALMCLSILAAQTAAARPSETTAVVPYSELTTDDILQIEALAAEFIQLLQTDSVMAAMLMIAESHILGNQVQEFSALVGEECPVWDSISTGKSETLSRDIYQRDYYLISEGCAFRLRFEFGRSNGRWRIISAVFMNPQLWI